MTGGRTKLLRGGSGTVLPGDISEKDLGGYRGNPGAHAYERVGLTGGGLKALDRWRHRMFGKSSTII